MKTELKEVLQTLDDIDFRELFSALSIAQNVRSLLVRHNLTIEQFSEKIGTETGSVSMMLNGSANFDLRTISKVHSLAQTLESEKAGKELPPIIGFPDTRFSNMV